MSQFITSQIVETLHSDFFRNLNIRPELVIDVTPDIKSKTTRSLICLCSVQLKDKLFPQTHVARTYNYTCDGVLYEVQYMSFCAYINDFRNYYRSNYLIKAIYYYKNSQLYSPERIIFINKDFTPVFEQVINTFLEHPEICLSNIDNEMKGPCKGAVFGIKVLEQANTILNFFQSLPDRTVTIHNVVDDFEKFIAKMKKKNPAVFTDCVFQTATYSYAEKSRYIYMYYRLGNRRLVMPSSTPTTTVGQYITQLTTYCSKLAALGPLAGQPLPANLSRMLETAYIRNQFASGTYKSHPDYYLEILNTLETRHNRTTLNLTLKQRATAEQILVDYVETTKNVRYNTKKVEQITNTALDTVYSILEQYTLQTFVKTTVQT